MTNFRNSLIDRMVSLYGLENPIVVDFCQMCERLDNNDWNDKCLAIVVACHEDETAIGE